VPVAYEVATALGVPLDVFVVRKLGVPGREELATGAIASGGVTVINDDVARGLGISPEVIEQAAEREGRELLRREQAYREGRPFPEVTGEVTGETRRRALRKEAPDTQWHAVRIRAKRCRYAAEAVAPVFGHQAGRFAAAIAAVQAILGDHQDTVVAEAWLRATGAALSPACVSAGELIAAERQERARLRSRWSKVWKRATARKPRRWL
jgi:CHAD domain-containing protein